MRHLVFVHDVFVVYAETEELQARWGSGVCFFSVVVKLGGFHEKEGRGSSESVEQERRVVNVFVLRSSLLHVLGPIYTQDSMGFDKKQILCRNFANKG